MPGQDISKFNLNIGMILHMNTYVSDWFKLSFFWAKHIDKYKEHRSHTNSPILPKSKRETCKEMGPLLWNSFNTVFILLEEVMSIYKSLSPGQLTTRDFNRVWNALALFQCMASHPDTKMSFIKAKIPDYLCPFIKTTETENIFELLRICSLFVIAALVKVDDSNGPKVTYYLLEIGMFPLCLHCMEFGHESTKTVATFIVSKILMQAEGMNYCFTETKRFYAVRYVLAGMLDKLSEKPSLQLLKLIIKCYISLSERARMCDTLQYCLPAKLRDPDFINLFREHPSILKLLEILLKNVITSQQDTAQNQNQLKYL